LVTRIRMSGCGGAEGKSGGLLEFGLVSADGQNQPGRVE
jgi:hypothetical protein